MTTTLSPSPSRELAMQEARVQFDLALELADVALDGIGDITTIVLAEAERRGIKATSPALPFAIVIARNALDIPVTLEGALAMMDAEWEPE